MPDAEAMLEITANFADLVGGTPLVRLTRLAPEVHVQLIGKIESRNPAGSVKDRIGVAMIDAAEAEGRIEPGRTTIVEATSGNTGIALAFVCAAKGYELVLSMPQGMSRERENLLRLYGARAGRADRQRIHPRPVLQSGQSGDPPAHDCRGDLA